MKYVLRGVVGLVGVLGLLIAARFWLAPAEMAAQLGILANGGLGLATTRADLAGFFGCGGGLAVAAAISENKRLLTAPLLLVAVALTGRVATSALSGLSQDMVLPMIVEAGLCVVFATGRKWL